jgi:RimJ/RimL family protein N-acetyltransferase
VTEIDLRGARVRIRRARLDDADASFRWFADAQVTRYLPLAGERILPMPEIVEFLGRASRDDASDLSVGIELHSGRLIGCGGLRNIDADSAEISIVIGERDVWDSGYGREAMQLLLQHGFERLQLQTIWLVARTENARAIRLFTRLGFVVTETLVAATTVGGIPRDKVRMQLTRAVWAARSDG